MTTKTAPSRRARTTRRLPRGADLTRAAVAYRPMLLDVTVAFLLSRILFYVTAAIAIAAIPAYAGSQYAPWYAPTHPLIDASWRWDAGWYSAIIQHGYVLRPGESSIAFFPLYPLLVRLALIPFSLHWMYLAGVLINHVAFFLALVAVWLYAERAEGRTVAQRALYLLCIFPTSFFFAAAYSEAIFLLVTAAALLALQRGRFALAGGAGFFAALTRPPGLYLAVPFVLEAWRRRSPDWRVWITRAAALLFIPAGLLAFMAYLWWRFDDPLLFLTAQGAWNHARMFPLVSLYEAIRQIQTGDRYSIGYVMNVVNTSAAMLALALGIVLARRDVPAAGYVLVSALTALTFPIEGAPSISLARYVVVLFPIFIPLARWASRWSVQVLLTAAFLPANVLLAALFIRWYWVI